MRRFWFGKTRDIKPPTQVVGGQAQHRVASWTRDTFGNESATNLQERALCAAEGAIKLAHACGADRESLHRLVDYIYGRPLGNPSSKVAGTMLTVYSVAAVLGIDADAELAKELERVQQPEVVERCRRRQVEKRAVLSGKT